MSEVSIYDRIKVLCAKRRLSVSQLEKDLGFGGSTLSKWVPGKVTPSYDKVQKVAQYFNVSMEYLTGASQVEETAEAILKDSDYISFQRAKTSNPDRYKIALEIVNAGFEAAFNDSDEE